MRSTFPVSNRRTARFVLRFPFGLLPAAALSAGLAVAGCATGPATVPDQAEATSPEPAREPLVISGLSSENESLRGLTLVLTGTHALKNPSAEAHWIARIDDEIVASGTVPFATDDDGAFDLEIPLRHSDDFVIHDSAGQSLTADVVVTLQVEDGGKPVEATRNIRLRRPEMPKVSIHLQASRSGSSTLNLVYYFAIRNPNNFDVRASVLRYEAFLSDKVVSDGELPLATRIPGWAENSFDILAEATVNNVGRELPALIRGNSLNWAFRGAVNVGGVEIPIDLAGPLELSR